MVSFVRINLITGINKYVWLILILTNRLVTLVGVVCLWIVLIPYILLWTWFTQGVYVIIKATVLCFFVTHHESLVVWVVWVQSLLLPCIPLRLMLRLHIRHNRHQLLILGQTHALHRWTHTITFGMVQVRQQIIRTLIIIFMHNSMFSFWVHSFHIVVIINWGVINWLM